MNTLNSQNLTNEELLSKIEELKFENRFGCISNSYFRYVIERQQSESPCLLIYGDFNDVGKANQTYGFKKTTLFMKQTLNNICEYLSNYYKTDVDCISLGGDEFLFLVNNINKDDISSNSLLENIQDYIFSDSKLSMSLGYSHYSNQNSLQMVLKEAQQMAEKNKQEKNKINNENLSLEDRFLLTITSYLNAIPTKGISKAQKQNIFNTILKIYTNYSLSSIAPTESKQNSKIVINEDDEKITQLSKNWKNNKKELQETLNMLSTNPITSGIRKSAFSNLIKYKSNAEFYYSYIDISHLKLSNLLLGHEKTDENIKKLIKFIRNSFAQEGINISTFDSKDNSNYIVNLSGCKFMLLLSKDNPNINIDKINSILQKIQNTTSESILGITYSTLSSASKLVSINKFERLRKNLKRKCNKQKNTYKKYKIVNPNTSKLWLKKLILQLTKNYQNAGYETFDFENIFKPALATAFESIPLVKEKNQSQFLDVSNFTFSNNCSNIRQQLKQNPISINIPSFIDSSFDIEESIQPEVDNK